MIPNGRVKLILVYTWGNRDIPIGDTADPQALSLAKECILAEANAEVDALSGLDPILRIDAECRLKMKKKVLGLLIHQRTATVIGR